MVPCKLINIVPTVIYSYFIKSTISSSSIISFNESTLSNPSSIEREQEDSP